MSFSPQIGFRGEEEEKEWKMNPIMLINSHSLIKEQGRRKMRRVRGRRKDWARSESWTHWFICFNFSFPLLPNFHPSSTSLSLQFSALSLQFSALSLQFSALSLSSSFLLFLSMRRWPKVIKIKYKITRYASIQHFSCSQNVYMQLCYVFLEMREDQNTNLLKSESV